MAQPHVEQDLVTFKFTHDLGGVLVARSLVFCVVLCRSLFVLLFFIYFLAVVFDVFRVTAFDYSFSIFQLFVFLIQHLSHKEKMSRLGFNVLYVNAAQLVLCEDRHFTHMWITTA